VETVNNIELRDIIIKKLEKIEKENDVKILYAVESGSRGWGFESPDSDYDVRFIYIHKPDWYLSIQSRKDVIELPINDLLDINGWDIRKTLVLFSKSNPTLLEWLTSPIIYKQSGNFIETLKTLQEEYFRSASCVYHYLHMAEGNYREYLKGDLVKVKKYFYVLRPIMACIWIEKYKTQPPMLFETLLNSVITDPVLLKEINILLKRKRKSREMDEEQKIDVINEFLEEKILYFNEYVKQLDSDINKNVEHLDRLFRETLQEVWS